MTRVTSQVHGPAGILTWMRAILAALAALALLAIGAVAQPSGPLELYRRLATVGLDPARVYRVNDLNLDREDIHITFNDGTIGFTQAVDGHITGAFFEGEGEVLLLPPDSVERGSMSLFTGAAILDERFRIAYLRFNDDTAQELMKQLREPADDPAEFLSRWDASARTLAISDSLRLLATFTSGQPAPSDDRFAGAASRMLHISFSGLHLGSFDVNLDGSFPEQVFAGQSVEENGGAYYNLWTAFPMQSARTGKAATLPGPILHISRIKVDAQVVLPHDLQARARVSLDALRGGERCLIFELSRYLKIQSVTQDGKPLDFIQNLSIEGSQLSRRGNDVVAVILPQPLAAGQRLDLEFTYGGAVLSEAGGGLMYVGARGAWYPNLGLAMTDFDLTFRYPPGWTLLATGKRLSLQQVGGAQQAHWVSDTPIPVAGFNLGQYVETTVRAGNVAVEGFAAPGYSDIMPPEPMGPRKWTPVPRDPSKHTLDIVAPPSAGSKAASAADRGADAISFLASRLGPFPYTSLALTQMPGRDSQGWPGLIFLSTFAFLPQKEKDARLTDFGDILYDRLMLGHEVAHQWWGDTVTWKGYRDQWLIEALANYSAMLQLESRDPKRFRTVMDHYRRDLMIHNARGEAPRDAGPVTLGVRLNSSHFPSGYDIVSYGRGTWLLHMLRSILADGSESARGGGGDQEFARVLRGVVERYRGQAISTQEFLREVEKALPRSSWYNGKPSLDWFYKGWVNGTALPRFEVEAVKSSSNAAGKWTVSGRILEKDAPDDLVTPVPVYAQSGATLTYLGRVFADSPETSFHLPAPGAVHKIVLDPYGTVLTAP